MPSAFLAYNARSLLPYLLIAMPVVLLAVWLSVRNGLRPLQMLAERIEHRTAGDLQPVGFDARHRELRPLVQALDTLIEQARERVQRERAFVQDAAHEMRTPLAVVTAQAHVLARSPDAAARVAAQQHLEQAIVRAAHLAQQLLDLAALDEAPRAASAAAAALDIAAQVRAQLAQAAPGAMAQGIELALDAPDELWRAAEPAALQSIVANLVDNAVRYSGAGSGSGSGRGHGGGRGRGSPSRATVQVTLAAGPGEAWSLAVQDDGPGIDAAEQPRVFDRFTRGAGQAASGSGLGLAIVRQAALRLGGQVRIVDGLHGRGVGMQVDVPAQDTAAS